MVRSWLACSCQRVKGTDPEGVAGPRHNPTLRSSHDILPFVWFVWDLGLVAGAVGANIRDFRTKRIVPFGLGYSWYLFPDESVPLVSDP